MEHSEITTRSKKAARKETQEGSIGSQATACDLNLDLPNMNFGEAAGDTKIQSESNEQVTDTVTETDKIFVLPSLKEMETLNQYGPPTVRPKVHNMCASFAAGDQESQPTDQVMKNFMTNFQREFSLSMADAMREVVLSTKHLVTDLTETAHREIGRIAKVTSNSSQEIPLRVSDHERSRAHNQSGSHVKRSRQQVQTDSSSSDDDMGHESSNRSSSHSLSHNYSSRSLACNDRNSSSVKIPPFTGKEQWKVWISRFMEVANRKGWDNERKLDEILPRLQGPAGEFVYGQLSHTTRTSFRALLQELNSRFRVVETTKTFGVQFNNRVQKSNESVEEFAADLKRLYDKAYASRDANTRKEDLLRKFLDGLSDERTRFNVEYIKEPEDIDRAVYDVVNFQETRRRPNHRDTYSNGNKRSARKVRTSQLDIYRDDMVSPSEDEDEDQEVELEEDSKIARALSRANKNKQIVKVNSKATTSSALENKNSDEKEQSFDCKSEVQKLTDLVEKISDRINKIEAGNNQKHNGRLGNRSQFVPNRGQGQNRANGHNKNINWRGQNQPQVINQPSNSGQNSLGSGFRANISNRPQYGQQYSTCCFRCGQEGHFSRDCPLAPWVTGHMQVAVQPGPTQPNVVHNPVSVDSKGSTTKEVK